MTPATPPSAPVTPVRLSARFEEALVYATRLHAGQPRKGTRTPYVAHLLGVSSLVLEQGGDEDQAIAALLHDAVEDQGGLETLAEIRRRFGDRVAEMVLGSSDAVTTPKAPWRQRKEAYIAHLREAPADERLISAADKLHNARALLYDYRTRGEAVWRHFKGGRDGTLWYYDALLEAFQAAGPTPLVDELARVVAAIKELVGK